MCVCVWHASDTRRICHTHRERENKRPNLPQRIVRCLRVVPEGRYLPPTFLPPAHPAAMTVSAFALFRCVSPRLALFCLRLCLRFVFLVVFLATFRFVSQRATNNLIDYRFGGISFFWGLPFFVSSLSPARPAVATTTATKRGTHRARNVLSFPLSSSFLCDK